MTAHLDGAGGDMEDGVLKEGFLVKRVRAPEPVRTLARAARGGWAPAHLSGVCSPSQKADRPPGALPGRDHGGGGSWWTVVGGRLSIAKGPRHRGQSQSASADGVRVVATKWISSPQQLTKI